MAPVFMRKLGEFFDERPYLVCSFYLLVYSAYCMLRYYAPWIFEYCAVQHTLTLIAVAHAVMLMLIPKAIDRGAPRQRYGYVVSSCSDFTPITPSPATVPDSIPSSLHGHFSTAPKGDDSGDESD